MRGPPSFSPPSGTRLARNLAPPPGAGPTQPAA